MAAQKKAAKSEASSYAQREADRKKAKARNARIRKAARRLGMVRVRYRRRRAFGSPEEAGWRIFVHDVDTLLHELVKHPDAFKMTPEELVAKAEGFADAYHAMQERRRPRGVKSEPGY